MIGNIQLLMIDSFPFQISISDSMDTCDCQAAIIDQAVSKSMKTSTVPELIFVFQNLQAQVQYCVQSIGIYRVIEEFRVEPEITCGGSVSIQTDSE